MKTFQDIRDETWEIVISVGSARRVRDETGHDLLEITRGKPDVLNAFVDDVYALGSLLWSLCRPQAENRDLSPEEFAERLGNADVIEAAVQALLQSLIDFFPERTKGPLQTVLARINAKMAKRQTAATAQMEEILNSPKLDADLDALIDSQFSRSVSSSPASSE